MWREAKEEDLTESLRKKCWQQYDTNYKLHACLVFKATKGLLSFDVWTVFIHLSVPWFIHGKYEDRLLETWCHCIFSFVPPPLLSVFVLYTSVSCLLFSPSFCYYVEQKQKKIYSQISVPAVGLLTMTSCGKLPRTIQDVWMFATTKNCKGKVHPRTGHESPERE